MAQGTIWGKSKQAGSGHGARNHAHASGNGLSQQYYASFHCGWHPLKTVADNPARELSYKKRRRKKQKQ